MQKWSLCLLGILSFTFTAGSQAQSATGSVEKAIIALENQWLQAAKTQNPDLVAANYDERMLDTTSDGEVVTKAGGLRGLKETKLSSGSYDDLQVRVFGDTAIAAGGFASKGTDAKGKSFDIHERFTDTWIKNQSGKWICVASHSSLLAK